MTSNDNIGQMYQEAEDAAKSGNYMNAIVLFTKVLDRIRLCADQRCDESEEDGGIASSDVFAWRAYAWYMRNEHEIALLDINEALRESPRNPGYYRARAQMRRELFQYGLAINDLSIAIEYDSVNPDYYYQRSIVHFHDSNLDSSLQDIEKAIELAASFDIELSMQYHVQRAEIYLKLEKHEIALNDCEKVIESDTSDETLADAFRVKGEIHLARKEYAVAQEMFSQAIKRNPNLRTTDLSQAKCCFERQDFEAAKLYCNQYIDSFPRSWEAMQLRGQCYYYLGDNENAKNDCQRAYEYCPNIESCTTLVSIYQDMLDYVTAGEWSKKKSQLQKIKKRPSTPNLD